jgi:hypothetical protein
MATHTNCEYVVYLSGVVTHTSYDYVVHFSSVVNF